MPALSLTLCGRVSVTLDGVSPSGAPLGNKGLALLAFLALERGRHSREELTALLWGEYPEEKAKASLRQALTHLREAVGEAVGIDRTGVELTVPVETDVQAFLRTADQAPERAVEIDIPNFLAGLQVRHSPAFEEWADGKRRTLLRRFAEALAAAARESVANNRWSEAVSTAERWIAIDALSADANLALVEAHFLARNRVAALNAFADYRSRLLTETGRHPDQRLLDLAQRIGDAPTEGSRQTTDEWYANAPSFHGSLIGRTKEWERLQEAWRSVRSGSRVALIEGEAGVGKSRLVDDFSRLVTTEGATTLRGRGYDARGGVPFGAIVEALRSGIDAPGLGGTDPTWLAEVARLIPELRERFPGLPEIRAVSTADGWRLFEGIAQLLLALSEETPVAVLIDDLQWCDADSCALLHFLIRKLDTSAVFWCLTFAPGAVERDSPAARMVRALRALRGTVSVALQPLSEDDVWHLVRSLGRVTAPTGARRLAARIYEVTAGYPFYVIELLRTLFAEGWLTVDPGTGEWIVRQFDAADASILTLVPSVHDSIAERIEVLSEELRDVLITVAVTRRGCTTNVLSHVHGISRLRAAAIGDALVERHLVVEEDGKYRCAHPVIERIVDDGLGTSRRREVHRGLALTLQLLNATDGDPLDPGEIARHAEQAGERSMAYHYAMLAAESCERRFAFEDALGWLDLAASVAATPEDGGAVNRTTARLLEMAEWRDRPPVRAPMTATGRMAAADFDLPVR